MASNWRLAGEALLTGRTIRIPDRPANVVTGRLSSNPKIKGHWRINVRETPDGVVTWLTKKEDR